MKRILAIAVLASFVISATELHELIRLPLLFEHYSELKERSEELSFVDFLLMHYNADAKHDEHDSRLPFKSPAHACAAPVVTVCTAEIILLENSCLSDILHSSMYREAFIPSHLSKIFQPPRLG